MTAAGSPSTLPIATPSPAAVFVRDYLALCRKYQFIVSRTKLGFCEPCDELDDEVALAVRALVECGDSLIGMEDECAGMLANQTYVPDHVLAAVMRLLGESKCRELVSAADAAWFFGPLNQFHH